MVEETLQINASSYIKKKGYNSCFRSKQHNTRLHQRKKVSINSGKTVAICKTNEIARFN